MMMQETQRCHVLLLPGTHSPTGNVRTLLDNTQLAFALSGMHPADHLVDNGWCLARTLGENDPANWPQKETFIVFLISGTMLVGRITSDVACSLRVSTRIPIICLVCIPVYYIISSVHSCKVYSCEVCTVYGDTSLNFC